MIIKVIILFKFFLVVFSFDKWKGDNCISTLTNTEGSCVEPQDCDSFHHNKYKINICSFVGKIPIVCCPKFGVRFDDDEVLEKRISEKS